MAIKLFSQKFGALSISNENAGTRQTNFFPGGEVMIWKANQSPSFYFIQEINLPYFTLRYCCFYSSERDLITVESGVPSITFRLGYNHSHQLFTKELGKQVFHERAYNLFFDPTPYTEYAMASQERFIFVDLLLHKDYSLYLQQYYPTTEQLIAHAHEGSAGKLYPQSRTALIDVWRWQDELLDWCYYAKKEEKEGIIIGHKLIEAGITTREAQPDQRGIELSLNEANRISDAAEIILTSTQSYTAEMLAKRVGISANKLKTGFKEIFGHSISEHRFEDKMLSALRLVDFEGISLEQLASSLGYSQPLAFLKDFKKRFGYEPFGGSKPGQASN